MTTVRMLSLREIYAAAWIEGLQRHDKPQERSDGHARLDDTGRAVIVPLRGSRG